ncbi:hypothetical protein SAMN05216241_10977 [Limimonas halophila]|uniref:GatB/YqeY domain-containing protein n=1 Tax=Limimonas halophila TaxID=1082479 RepID=A0A1G7TIH6_9PROT|nr:GatB/YqeY domain-containing protein [Limimonas halophila]SDG34350.1 hypothetical protein SAMN05216241_10977 [Limimonas halophila]
MLRQQLNDALKQALRTRDERTAATLRLILAALKDRDIAARAQGSTDGIDDDEIQRMLEKLAQQSREAAANYDRAGRADLAEKERQEIEVIQRFLPRQLDEAETRRAVDDAIQELGAHSLKDMGRVMNHLRSQYRGRMDFTHASSIAKHKLD